MNKNNTEKISLGKLLSDDYFLLSIMDPTPESERFWATQISSGLLDQSVFAEAKRIVLSERTPSEILPPQFRYLWQRISTTNSNEQHKASVRRRISIVYSGIAACLAIFLLLLNFNKENSLEARTEIDFGQKEQSFPTEIQLITASNQIIEIQDEEAVIDYSEELSVKINNQKLDIKKETAVAEIEKAIEYNEIIVPAGKRTKIILSDNSQLWINAGSRVRYPVVFAKDKREIYVEGEVYGDIAKMPTAPFTIKTDNFDVVVLGTSLDISAYKNDVQHVVLVEGSVKIASKTKKEYLLKPNQQFSLNDEWEGVKTIDTEQYVSWKSGYYTFNDSQLSDILNFLSRYYGVRLQCNEKMSKTLCSGRLDLKDNIDDVLQGICFSLSAEFQLNNDKYELRYKN